MKLLAIPSKPHSLKRLSKETPSGTGEIWLGIFFLGTTIFVLLFSGSIQSIGLGENFDPGPKAFPIGLSILLAMGGAVEFFKRKERQAGMLSEPGEGRIVLLLLAAFLIYVLLLPWLGFALSTAVMATGMMMLLGNSWRAALSLTATLIVMIYLLFVVLFKVPLPGGVFSLPF